MLSLDPKKVMLARGIATPFAFLRDAGIPASAAHKIYAGLYERPSLKHIELMCILLKCTPNDLLTWVPDKGQDKDIPLNILQKEDEDLDFLKKLQALPIDELRRLGQQLREGK